MADSVKIGKIGNSLGVTLSDSVRALGLEEGDSLYVVRTETGIELTPYDPDFAEALDTAREFMRKHPNAMKALSE